MKIEQEVRRLPERERAWNVDRFIPIVESLVSSPEGKRDLAAICASYLREHRPETTVSEPTPAAPSPPELDRPRGKRRRPQGGQGGRRRGRR